MPSTSLSALPYPQLTGSNNPPADLQALALALDPLVTPQIQTYPVVWQQQGGTTLNIGNGTLEGKYVKVGRLVHWRVYMLRGSTTNVGTNVYSWTLPFTADTFNQPVGTGLATVGGAFKTFNMRLSSSATAVGIRPDDSSISNSSFSWAAGDAIMFGGTYLASS